MAITSNRAPVRRRHPYAAAMCFACAMAFGVGPDPGVPQMLRAASERESKVTVRVPPSHIMMFGKPAFIVREVVDGALRRVSRADCARVIGEMNDAEGRPLAWNLSERGMTPVGYLAALRFYEGDGLRQCQYDTTVAVTVPNSRVIWVCGRRFARYFALDRPQGEIIVIHEMLHSLGLGENPPSSAEITDTVEHRCGD